MTWPAGPHQTWLQVVISLRELISSCLTVSLVGRELQADHLSCSGLQGCSEPSMPLGTYAVNRPVTPKVSSNNVTAVCMGRRGEAVNE